MLRFIAGVRRNRALGIVLLAILLVVGCGNTGRTLTGFTDTWTWNGQAWTDRSTGAHPGARQSGAFVFDEARGVAVLFGGQGLDGQMLDDTWTWDGQHWTRLREGRGDIRAMPFALFGGYGLPWPHAAVAFPVGTAALVTFIHG